VSSTVGTNLSSEFVFIPNSWKCKRKFLLLFLLSVVFLQWVFFFLFVFLVFGWVYCVLNLKTVIGFITACMLIDSFLQYTSFCTQTKHSCYIMACYTYTTVKICWFCYILLPSRNSQRYFPTDRGQYQYRWNKS